MVKNLEQLGISPTPWHVDELNDVVKKNNAAVPLAVPEDEGGAE